MASGSGLKKVWVKVEDGEPRTATGVRVENDADIDDVVAKVIRAEGLNIGPGLVSVEFDGNKIRRSAVVSDYQTTEDKPLLLKCYVKDGATCYVVDAYIPNNKQGVGTQAAVYRKAEECFAFFVPGTDYIWYGEPHGDPDPSSNTLCIHLFFKQKRDAMSFQAALRNWKFFHPFMPFDQPVVPALREERVENLEPVKLVDCIGNDTNSPCMSLEDCKGYTSSLSSGTSVESLDTPLVKYQSIERLELFKLFLPYTIHLKDKAKFSDLRKDENNTLAGSWGFHQLVDGLNTSEGDGVPLLQISCLQVSEHLEEVNAGEMRRRVDLKIEFLTAGAANYMSSRLKVGSEQLQSDELPMWKTWVYVEDHEKFCKCLEWKAEDTSKRWKQYQAKLNAI